MESNEKFSFNGRIGIFISIVLAFSNCSKIDCEEINKKSASMYSNYFDDYDKSYLDSSLFYLNIGIENCPNEKKILSLRKLTVLSELNQFGDAIDFIDSWDTTIFTVLPYYSEVLSYRFKAMEASSMNDNLMRDKYLSKCVSIINSFLEQNSQVDSIFNNNDIEQILQNPFATSYSQYYYYKSIYDTSVVDELDSLKNNSHINKDYIDYLKNIVEIEFMEFHGF